MSEFKLPRKGTSDNPVRIAIFISGSGSGMEALLNYQNQNKCSHKTVLVISNKPGVEGIQRAKSKNVLTKIIELPKEIKKAREAHEDLIQKHLVENRVELIVLSGYMRILSTRFVGKWLGRLLNIHPSLLPKFPGANPHKEVLESGTKESGCTVHFVDSGVDSGPIIAQEKVKVFSDDSLEDLQNRVKLKEHKIYPRVLDLLCEGYVSVNRKQEVIIEDHSKN
ncbi:MAG: phosphoribosylglycinamide formyltransferase [Methanobacteriota archaeon]|nr:MAG: phosphoribosylglycinamide formyltransferase [Euryarchaeota archaeon]|tara:strand:- start:4052 stop:4720 length:669 start_codon:yes stop_codon:yes gene_type:complete